MTPYLISLVTYLTSDAGWAGEWGRVAEVFYTEGVKDLAAHHTLDHLRRKGGGVER